MFFGCEDFLPVKMACSQVVDHPHIGQFVSLILICHFVIGEIVTQPDSTGGNLEFFCYQSERYLGRKVGVGNQISYFWPQLYKFIFYLIDNAWGEEHKAEINIERAKSIFRLAVVSQGMSVIEIQPLADQLG